MYSSWTVGAGNISKEKKIPTQGETEYTDFRKWRVMRSKKAYVPTGKTVHIRKPKARWVDAEVDDPLHSTHATLFCVASGATVKRALNYMSHSTPFLQDRATYYKIPSSRGSRQKTTDYFWQGPTTHPRGLSQWPV